MTLLTEEEAKTKWCPLARVPLCTDEIAGNYIVGNRAEYSNEGSLPRGSRCIASACMAWRSEVQSLSHTDRDGEHPEIVMGYCGAFGPPDTAVSP